MSFSQAISSGFNNYTNFSGRASRSAFWFWALFVAIVELVGFLLLILLHGLGAVVLALFWLALILPSIAVAIRRLHDTDRSGWWLLLDFVPFGGIVLLVFFVLEGTPGPNRHGAAPDLGPAPMPPTAA